MFNELIKNFEKIRTYMREFYVYGLKSRDEYDRKSARSYDDERRRIESWLGEYVGFTRAADGKNAYISIDSRNVESNPLYKAWKTKSFTDGDITLHFILFDILNSGKSFTLSGIIDEIDKKLSAFENPMTFDESTVRKKLKEYCEQGLIERVKAGKSVLYKVCETVDLSGWEDALNFYSEVLPCGVIGSFILDKLPQKESAFNFKHHYVTSALDSEVLAILFDAMREKRIVSFENWAKAKTNPSRVRVIPLKIFSSAQNGRQQLIAYSSEFNSLTAFRIDRISKVKKEEITPRYDELKQNFKDIRKFVWGVSVAGTKLSGVKTERVEFTVKVASDEKYVINRLEREKRIGTVEKIDDFTYRYSAETCDSYELIPWIRTFICRITDLKFSNPKVEREFKKDLNKLYETYGVKGGGV